MAKKELAQLIIKAPDRETILAVRAAVLEILNARADQSTIRAALSAFMKGVQSGPTTIANCVFNGRT